MGSVFKFYLRVILFLSLGFLVMGLLSFTYKKMIINPLITPSNFEEKDKITTLILGDSHSRTLFNPRYIKNSVNHGRAGENFFYNYYKLLFFTKNNPQIKNIVLSFSYHSLSTFNENKRNLFSRPLKRYYMLLDDEGKDIVKGFNESYISNYLKYDIGLPIFLNEDLKNIKRYYQGEALHYPFLSHYISGKGNSKLTKKRVSHSIDRHYYMDFDKEVSKRSSKKEGKISKRSDLMVKYLKKIAHFCKKNKLKLHLVHTPIHKSYEKQVPREYKILYTRTIRQLKKKYKCINFINLSDFPLKDIHFRDGDHVNQKGATIISKEFNKLINKR